VTFTAKVTPQFSGTVKGSVTFYDGATALKTVALSGGVAKFTTSTLASGSHNITATYNGSTSFDGSSASLTQTVNYGLDSDAKAQEGRDRGIPPLRLRSGQALPQRTRKDGAPGSFDGAYTRPLR
jgi:hypothetical protein